MSHMLTASGLDFHLAGPRMPANQYRIEDIAHSLAQINRYNGHCVRPYSVAEHSLLCADLAAAAGASPSTQLACLMHDAHEAFVGDMASPVKAAMGQAWRDFEAQHEQDLHRAHGLRIHGAAHRDTVKRMDLIALATERRDLMRFDAAVNLPWAILDTAGAVVEPDACSLNTVWRMRLDWIGWQERFLERHAQLVAAAQVEARRITSGEQPLGAARQPQAVAIETDDQAQVAVQRALTASAAQAAMAAGYEGNNEPFDDDLLHPFWSAGRALAAAEDRLSCLTLAGMDRLPALAELDAQSDEPTLTLGDVADRLGFRIPAAFLAGQGIEPAVQRSGWGLYRESDFRRILAALGRKVIELRTVQTPAIAAEAAS